jgi:glyoxylase-like metal-dependent hydrolase (beta-lactamase superfamily II)
MLREAAGGVRVHQSPLLRNNTVVVQGADGVLLIDPGITNDELAALAAELHALGEPVVAGFATHPDWDHALWHPDFGDSPRYGTAACAADLRALLSSGDWRARFAEALPPELAGEVPLELFGLLTGLPEGTTHLPWDGPSLRILEHRAHAAGHAALLIEDRGVLVAGDMLSDVLVPMLDLGATTPIDDYLAALDLFESVVGDVELVIPGHGSIGAADELRRRLDQDRAYVLALRDGTEPDDPRIDDRAEPGWEWVSGVHAWQRQRLGGGAG